MSEPLVEYGWEQQTGLRENLPDYSEFAYNTLTVEQIDWIVDDATQRALELAEEIKAETELTWDTTMGRMLKIGQLGEYMYGRACFMGSVHPDKAVREAAEEALLRFFRQTMPIYFDPAIYDKLHQYCEEPEVQEMFGQRGGALNGYMEFFEKIGHRETPAKRDSIHRMYQTILENEIQFQRNIDEDDTIVLLNIEELEGMPQSFIDDLPRDDEGNYAITMAYPHVKPFLAAAVDRASRAVVKGAFDSRAAETNADLLEETANLRFSLARKLGYKGWSAYMLDSTDTMVESPYEVNDFHTKLLAKMSPQEAKEIKLLTDLLHADGYEGELQSYDVAYYKRKARQLVQPYDVEKAAEYFPADAVIEGVHKLEEELFGIEYHRLDPTEYPAWHEDVMSYMVHDSATGEPKGIIHLDLFPRPGKYSHPATFPLKSSYLLPDGTRQLSETAIVCNFSRFMSLSDTVTFTHEDGHGLHNTLGIADEPTHAGFAVEFDFVEAPSQIMEMWVAEPEILKTFARHHKTGEPIPDDLVEAMTKSSKLYNAIESVMQIAKAEYDQHIHYEQPIGDFKHYVEIAKDISPYVQDDGSYFPANFGHLMGGYDCLYFGYDYSLARAAIMFQRFKDEGLRNPVTGMEFRQMVLEPAGTEYGQEMFENFTGKKTVSLKPLLESKGFKVR